MYQSHGRFSGRRNFNNNFSKRNGFKQRIDENLFVKAAEKVLKIEETETKNLFEDFGFQAQLLTNIKDKGYKKPTPIQDQIIGAVMEGRDVLGIADTGTGKTAAFALPIINELITNPHKRIIILAPTRELATQIKQEFRSFTPGLKVYIALAIGGAYIREQIIDIRRGAQIIIGTPGRIKDLGQRRVIDFGKFNKVVLDEVDRMLDMGFVDEIREIMDQIPQPRQTLFFSATVNNKVGGLIETLLNNPVKVSLESRVASNHVEQNVVRCKRGAKEQMLLEILNSSEVKKVLIFGETKALVEQLSTKLFNNGLKADSIHGDKPQNKRTRVLKAFKENQINILVATDVAARGLDIGDITHVINYTIPNNYDDYIHRIGRTGRGDAMGYALTFIEEREFRAPPAQGRPGFGRFSRNTGGWSRRGR
ncbi:MAG: DEAD/DEAH box helicase [Candidatus Shapirobacteria bacterium]